MMVSEGPLAALTIGLNDRSGAGLSHGGVQVAGHCKHSLKSQAQKCTDATTVFWNTVFI